MRSSTSISLAKTNKLMGTCHSTFSYEAAVIGDVPFIELGEDGVRQYYTLGNNHPIVLDLRDRSLSKVNYAKRPRRGADSASQSADLGESISISFLQRELAMVSKPQVIDVGARTGVCSLMARHVVGSRFFAFEVDSGLRAILESNLVLNNLETQVEVYGIQLSDKAGTSSTPSRASGDGSARAGDIERKVDKSGDALALEVETLDGFVETKQLERLDFIRIDGRETTLAILEGGRNSLLRFQPRLLIEFDAAKSVRLRDDQERGRELLQISWLSEEAV